MAYNKRFTLSVENRDLLLQTLDSIVTQYSNYLYKIITFIEYNLIENLKHV